MQLCIEYSQITSQTLHSFSSTVQHVSMTIVSCPISIKVVFKMSMQQCTTKVCCDYIDYLQWTPVANQSISSTKQFSARQSRYRFGRLFDSIQASYSIQDNLFNFDLVNLKSQSQFQYLFT